MIKLAMISIQKEIREKKIPAAMLIQVHDELVFEVLSASAESAKNRIVELMADAIPLNVPVKVDAEIGPNWLETK
jgi:DNA polymerase-1